MRSSHCRSGRRTTGWPPRSRLAVDHFLVGQHRAQRRAPVHRHLGLVRQPVVVLVLAHRGVALLSARRRGSAARAIGRPFFCAGSYQVSKSGRKIHCVHLK